VQICDFGLARGFEIEEEDKDLTHYVVTRWYRAPEVILTARQYTKAIDVWAVGCILAEIVARKPLFQGKDPKDQIDLIIRAFGMPSAQDANWLKHNDSAYRFLRNLKTDGPKSWQQLFPNVKSSAWTKELLQMLNETLHFNPEKRISVQGAIELPYLKELHDPSDEPVCEYAVAWEFDKMEMTKRAIQNAIYQESADFHPYLEARDTAWFQQRNMRFPKPFNRRTRSNTLA
jgi:mitogen-activated protein kinase 1/3